MGDEDWYDDPPAPQWPSYQQQLKEWKAKETQKILCNTAASPQEINLMWQRLYEQEAAKKKQINDIFSAKFANIGPDGGSNNAPKNDSKSASGGQGST